jgi:biotin transport system substrate-specific component
VIKKQQGGQKMKNSVKTMTCIALMSAVMCILGPLSIPIGPVPITLTNLVIFITVYLLGMKYGAVSYLIYFLLGLAGVPVFSGYTGGPAKVLGPTGGYLIGFFLMAVIAGLFTDRFRRNKVICILGMVLATAVMYALGTVWLMFEASLTFGAALAAGVLPFIWEDLIKIVLSAFLGPVLRSRLSGVLPMEGRHPEKEKSSVLSKEGDAS